MSILSWETERDRIRRERAATESSLALSSAMAPMQPIQPFAPEGPPGLDQVMAAVAPPVPGVNFTPMPMTTPVTVPVPARYQRPMAEPSKEDQEAADKLFMDKLKENRRDWEDDETAKQIVKVATYRWLPYWGQKGFRHFTTEATPQENRAVLRILAEMNPEKFPESARAGIPKSIWKAAKSQSGLKVAGVTIDESTLIWGALFPQFTAAMLAGEAIARPIGRELGGELGEEIAGTVGGMAAGIAGPGLVRGLTKQATTPLMRGVTEPGFVGGRPPVLSERVGGAIAKGFAEEVYAAGPERTGEALERAALEKFGTTEALFEQSGAVRTPGGILLRDGRIVDLGGVGVSRMAHEEAVAMLVPRAMEEAAEPLMTFLRDTGAVRMAVGRTDELFVEIAGPLTKAQRDVIVREWGRSGGATVDIISPSGKSIRSIDVGFERTAGRTLRRFLDDVERNPPTEWSEAVPAGEYLPRRKPLPAAEPRWRVVLENGNELQMTASSERVALEEAQRLGYKPVRAEAVSQAGEPGGGPLPIGAAERYAPETLERGFPRVPAARGEVEEALRMEEAARGVPTVEPPRPVAVRPAGRTLRAEAEFPEHPFPVRTRAERMVEVEQRLAGKGLSRGQRVVLTRELEQLEAEAGLARTAGKPSVELQFSIQSHIRDLERAKVKAKGQGRKNAIQKKIDRLRSDLRGGEPELGGFPERFRGKARTLRGGPPKAEPTGAAPPGKIPPQKAPPVSGGAPPPDEGELLDRVIKLIRRAKKPGREQELIRHEERQRRYARMMEEIEAGGRYSPTEAERVLRAAEKKLGGKMPTRQFEPVRPRLTEDEVGLLLNRILQFDFGAGQGFKKVRGGDAFLAALMGKIPTWSELAILERVFGPDIVRALKAKGPLGRRLFWEMIDIAGLPRTALTILDHSFPGRQGIKLAPSHPREWSSSAWQGLRAMARERVAMELAEARATDSTPILVGFGSEVRSIPFARLKEMVELYEAPFGEAARVAAREEAYISRWARWLPGVKLSERAYITAGNQIRHDVLKKILLQATESGDPVQIETVRGLARLLNRATGRGTLGPIPEDFAPILNVVMFAPRYRLAAPQWLAHMFHSDPLVRREAWSQFWKFFTAGATTLAVLKVSGLADVEVDPRSSDFGKIRIGKQRIDFWAHLQQLARTAGVIALAQRKTSTGEVIGADRLDMAWRYFRTGASPFVGFLIDLKEGETIIGEEMEASPAGIRTQLFNRFMPLAFQDMIDSAREEGVRGALISTLALGGIGIQTYETEAQKRAKAFKEATGMEFDYNNPGHWAVLRTEPDLEQYAPASEQAQETQAFLTQEMENLKLPSMAAALGAGQPVGPQFREAWEDFEGTRAKAAARLAFGMDRGEPDDPSYLEWRNITRDQFRDSVTFEVDYGAYYDAKETAFERIPEPVKKALLQVGAPDPAVAQWASYLVAARNLRRDLYDIPKWVGLTSQQSQQLDDFTRMVGQQAPLIAQQQGQRVKEADVARLLATQQGTPELAEWFVALQSSRERDRLRNPEYQMFLSVNRGLLQMWFPELYSQATLEQIGAIEGEPPGMGPITPARPMQPMAVP